MRIPTTEAEREALYKSIIEKCFASRTDRKARYSVLKNYYLFGNGEKQQAVDYNKLFSHLDLLSSFLFSGETTRFSIETSASTDDQDPAFEREKAKVLVPELNNKWHDTNLDIVFNDALIWALVYDTCFIKLLSAGKRELSAYVVGPQSVGVLREDLTQLDSQEAIAFEFFMTEAELEKRMDGWGEEARKKITDYVSFEEKETVGTDGLPLPLQKLIINTTEPQLTGNISQMVAQFDFVPKVMQKVCTAYELWVWDDDRQDYRCATMIEGAYLLFDSDSNPFVPEEQPFIKVSPNTIYDYFWGRSELMYLIPLQEWVNIRVKEIKEILGKIADPPKAVSGFDGVPEEKMVAYNKPGGWLWNSQPTQASVTENTPNSPNDLFAEFSMIESLFSEISGIRELMQGKGESGVRATSHADLLVRVGSSRVKKKAGILEDAVEKCGHLILKLMRKYDDTHYKTEKGTTFIAKQLSSKAMVKVDSHSSSPIFIEQQLDKAQLLFQAGAMDKEDLVDAVKPQNAEAIKAKLKIREAAEAPLAQVKSLVETAKEDEAPGILNKLKAMFKRG